MERATCVTCRKCILGDVFLPQKLHYFACIELVSFIVLTSVSCAVCNFARAVACVKIAIFSALRKPILSHDLIPHLELHSRNTYLRWP